MRERKIDSKIYYIGKGDLGVLGTQIFEGSNEREKNRQQDLLYR